VIPAFGGTQRLSKYIGRNQAKELIYSGNFMDIDKACQLGLVIRVLDDKASCLQSAVEYLQALKERGPLALHEQKKL
jgi:enoyl-CoA hydratase/carnithine racemase